MTAVCLGVAALLKRFATTLLSSSLLLAPFTFAQSVPAFDGKSWWEYVKVLADDNMEGRETGSPGLQRASAYVVDQLKKDGLQPAGSKGYYQPVKLISRQIDESASSIELIRNERTEPVKLGEDAMFSTRVDLAPQTEAQLVFVGYGLNVPEKNYNDYAGLNVKGKVAVIFTGSPEDMPSPLASHYQSSTERAKELRQAGAIGFITIPNPAAMDIPWSRMTLARKRPSMSLADPMFNDWKGIGFAATWNPEFADQLFDASGHTFAEIAALGGARKPLPRFPLTVSIKAKAKQITKTVESANIVAKLPGSDPQLASQYVVLSAHLDHLGIGEPINGDKIYNGAMDNASGSALVLDIADKLHAAGLKPKRSLLFLFVTAEEKGLLGSRYFASKPTVPKKDIVADLNTDMFLPIFPLKILTVYGLDESSLGQDARRAAKDNGVEVQPDPEPLRNLFIRSDQYSFIKQGVPSLAMKVGYEKGTPEEAAAKKWLHDNYHAPSDDLNQPVDLAAAGKFEEIMSDIGLKVADDPKPPAWNNGSFFERYAAGK
jgi:Zn-dependent M28 family amino/carboxypeptidase